MDPLQYLNQYHTYENSARDIKADETITKYNFPIGVASRDIALGEHVHVHNVRSDYTASYVVPAAS